MTPIKNLFKFAVNKYSYPHARIAFGSRVAGDSVLGTNVEISQGSYVYQSILGNHVNIGENCSVFASTLRDNTFLNSGCVIARVELESFSYVAARSQLADLKIGRFCSIGPEFLCGAGEHPLDFISTSPVFYSTREQCGTTFVDQNEFQELKHTTMGHDVWVGARVFVRSGVSIGNGAVIAAGAVVVSNVSDYAVVGGVPARIIRYRFDAPVIKELLQLEWWNWPEAQLRAAQSRFAQTDIKGFLDWAKER